MPKTWKAWSPKDEADLKNLIKAGLEWHEIAHCLKRTENACKLKAHGLLNRKRTIPPAKQSQAGNAPGAAIHLLLHQTFG